MTDCGFGGCATCEGRCCRQYVVPVTCLDVHDLSRALALAPEQFAALVSDPETETDGIKLQAGGPGLSLVLHRHQHADDRQSCVFLVELPDGTGRCGVYAHRPSVCRTYPTAFHHGSVAIRPDVMCPKGSWNLAAMDLPSWRLGLLAFEMNHALHRIVVARWNELVDAGHSKHPTAAGFFRFAMGACDELHDLRASYPPGALNRVVHGWGRLPSDEAHGVPEWVGLLHRAAELVGGQPR